MHDGSTSRSHASPRSSLQAKDGTLQPATLKLCKDLTPGAKQGTTAPACFATVTGYLTKSDGAVATTPTIFKLAGGPLTSVPADTTATCAPIKQAGAHAWAECATHLASCW